MTANVILKFLVEVIAVVGVPTFVMPPTLQLTQAWWSDEQEHG